MGQSLLFTNHLLALAALSARPDLRLRDLADEVGVTERAAHRIVSDLARAGYLTRRRAGARNRYEIHPIVNGTPDREPITRVLELISQGSNGDQSGSVVVDAAQPEAVTARFDEIFRAAPAGVAIADSDGYLVAVNPAFCALLQRDEHEVIGCHVGDFTHPDDLETDLLTVERLLAGEIDSYRLEERYIRRDRSEVWIRLSVSLMRDRVGEPRHFIAQVEDISERKAAENELRDSEALLTAVIENAPAGIMVRDLEGRYRRGNTYAAQTLGVTPAEIQGRAPEEFFEPEAAARIRAQDARVLASGEPASEEVTVARDDGQQCTYRVLKYPIRDHTGAVVGLGSFSLDITAQDRAEQELRESEQRLREAQELASFGSWEFDIGAERQRWSDGLCKIFGLPPGSSPTYQEFLALVHPGDREEVRALGEEAWDGSFSVSDYRVVRPDGDVRHVHSRRFGRMDDRGAVVQLWGTIQDVTEQVLAEQEIRAARERSQAIIAGMHEGYALTVDGEIVEVNDALCALTGFTRDELVGARVPFPFWPPELLDRTMAVRDQVVEDQGGTFEMTVMRKDGTCFDGEVIAQPARNPDGTVLGFVNTLRDVSEAKRHRTELERERQALREAQRLASIGSWDYDVINHLPGHWSAELWRMLALEPQSAAPPLPEFLAMVHPDDRARVSQRIALAMAEEQPFLDEFGMIAADGRELRVAFRAEVSWNDAGEIAGAFGTIQDVTERANREEQEVAVREIAQLVARAAGPAAVFDRVAEQVCHLFRAHSGVVARFEERRGRAVFVSAVTRDGRTLTGTELDLNGSTAPAAVYRTHRASRTSGARSSGYADSFAAVVAELSDAVAAPITVGGQLWGCLAVGFSGRLAPADTEERLARFADLVAMAIGNAEAWSTLSHQAATDALTGLANRRTFQERLQAEISRARRYGRNLSLVLLDLDHFKAVNDTHGHQLGDAVLVEVAERLRTQARDGEVVARFGGEEFAWLMPETDGDAAYLAAERMRHMIGSKPFDHVGVVTVSAGVAAIAHDIDGEELVQLADRGLYRAKDSGRDTSVLESRRAA